MLLYPQRVECFDVKSKVLLTSLGVAVLVWWDFNSDNGDSVQISYAELIQYMMKAREEYAGLVIVLTKMISS